MIFSGVLEFSCSSDGLNPDVEDAIIVRFYKMFEFLHIHHV